MNSPGTLGYELVTWKRQLISNGWALSFQTALYSYPLMTTHRSTCSVCCFMHLNPKLYSDSKTIKSPRGINCFSILEKTRALFKKSTMEIKHILKLRLPKAWGNLLQKFAIKANSSKQIRGVAIKWKRCARLIRANNSWPASQINPVFHLKLRFIFTSKLKTLEVEDSH